MSKYTVTIKEDDNEQEELLLLAYRRENYWSLHSIQEIVRKWQRGKYNEDMTTDQLMNMIEEEIPACIWEV